MRKVLLLCLLARPLAAGDTFAEQVRPLLARNCYACHTSSQMGGLQLDSRENLLKGGKSGPAIVPGDPEHSLLFQAVSQTHERLKMPPGKKLSAEEIAVLRSWIAGGAQWTSASHFWAFQPVRKPAAGGIDELIRAQWKAHGLKAVGKADRRTLIRRATFDLIGLPPTPEEVRAFQEDRSPDAFAKVVDRLLASPHYGERWGRYWLDVARYSDDHLNSTMDQPYPNAWRYRDWVIQAFNDDMPYNQFVKLQIAGDLVPAADRVKAVAGTGFYGLNPEFQDDRVDVTARGFLGMTVACAQCHDHKFDPIPQKDYYAMLSVFNNSEVAEYPLAPEAEVKAWEKLSKASEAAQKRKTEFVEKKNEELARVLAADTSRYVAVARGQGDAEGLNSETIGRWKKYLTKEKFDHPYRPEDESFGATVVAVEQEKRDVDEKNHKILGDDPSRGDLSQANLVSLSPEKYFLWRDLFQGAGPYNHAQDLEKHLTGEDLEKLKELTSEAKRLKDALPEKYAFLHVLKESSKMKKQRVYLRGARENPGDEVEPHFLTVLCDGSPKPFRSGSGRLELAESIASGSNPLTARVMVNRMWQHHFGEGLVRTASNFGELGDRPSNPELLDYLAARLVEKGWSLKALHREIMLSDTYQLGAANDSANAAVDPENRYLWRASRRRLDIEALRDAMLFVSGKIDLKVGGPAEKIGDDVRRRTVYGFVSRRKLEPMLALFDFPNPNNTCEGRIATNVPLQRLFFMNSGFVEKQAAALAERVSDIREAYLLLFGREPLPREIELGRQYLESGKDAWPRYAQVLLSSNEFGFVN